MITKDTFKQVQVVDTYLQHNKHFFEDKNCSSCFTKNLVEKQEKENHKDCPYCNGTLTYYAPNGADDVTAEVCPLLDNPNLE